jgi:hypothetical protein
MMRTGRRAEDLAPVASRWSDHRVTTDWPTALLTALRRGQLLVAEVASTRPTHRAWIAVYPRRPAGGASGFNVFHREFDRSYIDKGWCIGPDDGMVELREASAIDERQLTETLAAWKVSPGDLTYVHRSDYPV